MKLKYRLEESDYLTFQLYTASKSERIKKKRKRSRLIMVAALVVIIFIFIRTNDNFLVFSTALVGIIGYLLHPIYLRYLYRRHYANYVADAFKTKKLSEIATVIFNNDEKIVHTYDKNIDTKINLSSLTRIIELRDHVFFMLSHNSGLIVPKRYLNANQDDILYFKSIAESSEISYNEELDWKWK